MILRHHYRGGGFAGGGNAFARFELIDARLRDIARRPKVRAVAGHLTFGLHNRLPADARYVAILRDPVERTLSHHHVLPRSRPNRVPGRQRTGLVPPWLPPAPAGISLAEALVPGGYILDNLQTRMLCGIVSPYDELPADALERAKKNLEERFAHVGTTERFDELLALLDLELGWPAIAYRRSRAFAGRLRREDLSPDLLRLVEERNALDRDLHAFAGSLLDRAVERAGPDLAAELEVIRAATRRWNEPAGPPGAEEIRSLDVDARVVLALKEAELARAEVQLRKLAKKEKRRRKQSTEPPT